MSELEELNTGVSEANTLVLSRLVAEVAKLQGAGQEKWLEQFHVDLFVDVAKVAATQNGKLTASPRKRSAITATIDAIVAARRRLDDLGDQPKERAPKRPAPARKSVTTAGR